MGVIMPPNAAAIGSAAGAHGRKAADRELALDLQSHNQEKEAQQSVVDPVKEWQGKGPAAEIKSEERLPPGFKVRADRRVHQDHREHGHQKEQQASRWPPSNKIHRGRMNPVAEPSHHCFG